MRKLIIFDWDGTLFDSVDVIKKSLKLSFTDCGFEAPSDDKAQHIIGMGLKDSMVYLDPTLDDRQIMRIAKSYRDHYISFEKEQGLFDGVPELLENLLSQGSQLAVATGKSRKGLNRVIDRFQFGDLFSATRCADEGEPKPHPEMLHVILDQLQMQPTDAVMVGDTSFDVDMAHAAQMPAIAVSYGAHEGDNLKKLEPSGFANSVAELANLLTK